MIRILFVDDETNILQGLQRMLRTCRNDWTMYFANGGHEALDVLAKEPIDVVVSDMRMPGMNGAGLLNAVRETYPHVVRIILSGQAEREHVLVLAGNTHRYLSKPCDAEELKQTVTSVCSQRSILVDSDLVALVSRLSSVPSLPAHYDELQSAVSDEGHSQQIIASAVKNDIGMSCKVLQLVNSAFFGAPKSMSDPQKAATALGTETIRSLAGAEGVFTRFTGSQVSEFELIEISDQSHAVARMAHAIALADGCSETDAVHSASAGLLHATGKLIFASELPNQCREAKNMVKLGIRDIDSIERMVFGATNSLVAAYLLSLWGLPDSIVRAVAWQRCPSQCQDAEVRALAHVHVARVFADNMFDVPANCRAELCQEFLERIGAREKLPLWENACVEA